MNNFDDRDEALISRFNIAMRDDRDADELIGLCRGLLADGVVVEAEARFLLNWINEHDTCLCHWHGRILKERLEEYLADDVWTEEEQENFCELARKVVGVESVEGEAIPRSGATTLPLTIPEPSMVFENEIFVVTGKFATGVRNKVADMITSRGGEVKSGVSKLVDYLVIGDLSSPNWKHSSYGRKIEKAIDLRDQGSEIYIVSEEHWSAQCAECEPFEIIPEKTAKVRIQVSDKRFLKSKDCWKIIGNVEGEKIYALFKLDDAETAFSGECAEEPFSGDLAQGVIKAPKISHLGASILDWVKVERKRLMGRG
ncbi:BRCT domain-containing protein [Desulfovibrio sp. UCD-KL4C]|uniref:BRCT domain-containing protein n=1 Tax=Desulfovibrio sp. UCD-KL4C TaxID=2578120 RepID=UPI0025C4D07A|nr:BRCT domain-containing protein [Desulfovibrio sp. UCD-KL4C]